ncbi:MAG: hypothetical protein NXI24_10815 [bacterium]|nr:hypothetical protein [bacterium]
MKRIWRRALIVSLGVLMACIDQQKTAIRQTGFGADSVVVTVHNPGPEPLVVAKAPHVLNLNPVDPFVEVEDGRFHSKPAFHQQDQIQGLQFITLETGATYSFELNVREVIEIEPDRKIPIGKYILRLTFEVKGEREPIRVSGPFEIVREGSQSAIRGTVTDLQGAVPAQTIRIIDESPDRVKVSTRPFFASFVRDKSVRLYTLPKEVRDSPGSPDADRTLRLPLLLDIADTIMIPSGEGAEFILSVAEIIETSGCRQPPSGSYTVRLSFSMNESESFRVVGRMKIA